MPSSTRNATEYDAVVVGAGFAGLYMLHRLRGGIEHGTFQVEPDSHVGCAEVTW